MQVDWTGETIQYFDPITGEEFKAYLFVAALPCSSYLYVEACTDMKQENWLMCHIHAYEYFGNFVCFTKFIDNAKDEVQLFIFKIEPVENHRLYTFLNWNTS